MQVIDLFNVNLDCQNIRPSIDCKKVTKWKIWRTQSDRRPFWANGAVAHTVNPGIIHGDVLKLFNFLTWQFEKYWGSQ
jgi:hypothetical protein